MPLVLTGRAGEGRAGGAGSQGVHAVISHRTSSPTLLNSSATDLPCQSVCEEQRSPADVAVALPVLAAGRLAGATVLEERVLEGV